MPTPQIEKHLTANMNLKKRQIIIYNFLGGLSWGFGSVIGVSIVIAIIAWVLRLFGVFDTVSSFFPQNFK
jgi:hypothetical protein